jgi:hypothetical protein
MAKKSKLNQVLKSHPVSRQQEKSIRAALKSVAQLEAAGLGAPGYDLGSPFGNKRLIETLRPRSLADFKVTYDA